MTKRKNQDDGDRIAYLTWNDRTMGDYRRVAIYVARRQFQAQSTIAWLVSGLIVLNVAWFVFWIVRG